ncbi:MAG: DnaA regulatory inactivator Hda [Pseudomonadota bacterium]
MNQLTLAVRLADHADFDNFVAGDNAAAVAAARSLAQAPGAPALWLWGAPSTGRTHLLQAACAAAGRAGHEAAYLPLAEWRDAGAGALAGWERYRLLCVDDVEAIAADEAFELALFSLFNALVERGGSLLCAAAAAPAACGLALPDLVSRLGSGAVFRLEPLDESARLQALTLRCRRRGMTLPDETLGWLSRRYPRDLTSLFALLDTLDTESLTAKRRLTVPFVRSVLRRHGAADGEHEHDEERA